MGKNKNGKQKQRLEEVPEVEELEEGEEYYDYSAEEAEDDDFPGLGGGLGAWTAALSRSLVPLVDAA